MLTKRYNILITGGAGYNGSHICHLLIDQGHRVSCIDNLITGNKKLLPRKVNLNVFDIADKKKVSMLLKKNKFDVVIHLAGLIGVDESLKKPKKYYNYNYLKAKKFLDTCFKYDLKKIIFSSTASVYGNIKKKMVSENDSLKPLNPYAKSKIKLENYLIKSSKTNNVKYVILRYFNVAGADKKLRTGLISKNSNNLIKSICDVVTRKKHKLTVNGVNYKTKDGTTIRDYIHVSDLAEVHYLTLNYLIKNQKSEIFNCGYGQGFSILDVINGMNKISKKKIPFILGKPRKNDIEKSVANIKKLKKCFKWKPKYNNLRVILKTSLEWERKNFLAS